MCVCVCVCVNGANLDNLISRDSSDVLDHLRQVLDLHLSPVEESVQVSCGKEGDRQLVCVCVNGPFCVSFVEQTCVRMKK